MSRWVRCCFLLCVFGWMSSAQAVEDDSLLDTALEALVESHEPTGEEESAPAASGVVRIDRSDLEAWVQQQKLQAQVITSKAENQLWTVVLLSVVWLITFVMLLHFMRRQRCEDYVNAIGLNLIIFATVFMVLVVETDQQLTAGAGILGAIAGYLFRAMQQEPAARRASDGEAGKTGS